MRNTNNTNNNGAVQSAEQYIESLYPLDNMLETVKLGCGYNGLPDISVAPGYGRLLTMLVAISGARRLLEIGALGGYSGICLARGLGEGGSLLSLEISPECAATAKAHMRVAGLADKVEYRVGDAKDSLRQLEREGARFDLVFIDADKGGYPFYLDMADKLANPGALIVADNTLLHGRVADVNADSPSVRAMRAFNRAVAVHPALESAMLPAYDGLAIARVK